MTNSKQIFKQLWKLLPWQAQLLLLVVLLAITILAPQFIESASQDPQVNAANQELYLVTKVVDGDTIKVEINGEVQTVRLIGLDTPETVAPNQPVECFGREASNYLAAMLQGEYVSLQGDSSQTDTDRYDRLLRYVFLDGENINQKMIADGYGFEYTYRVPYAHQPEFQMAETIARSNGLGLWGSVCDYDLTQN